MLISSACALSHVIAYHNEHTTSWLGAVFKGSLLVLQPQFN